MSAEADELAVVQNEDLVGVLQAGGALADDEDGQAAGQSCQRLAQGGVGGVVQSAGAVVQNEDVGLALSV